MDYSKDDNSSELYATVDDNVGRNHVVQVHGCIDGGVMDPRGYLFIIV